MRILFACLVLTLIPKRGAIPLTLYYEALCWDSIRFITKELCPNYQYFKEHLTIDFVPYGKALHDFNATTGQYTFRCQHGRDECMGNKYQACGLAYIEDQETRLGYVTCVMSARNPSNIYSIEACATKYNLDFANLTTCAVSSEGDKLLASHGDKTWKLEPNLYYVPTVVFNNSIQINAADQRRALSDFRGLMCEKITTNKPEICNDIGLMGKIRHFFS